MGCCCYPQYTPEGGPAPSICFNVTSSEECGFGGYYNPQPCGGCNVVGPMSEQLAAGADELRSLAAHPMYVVLYDFRDLIMRRCELGREALALFDAHGEALLALLATDRRLRIGWLSLLARGTVFAQDMLRALGPARDLTGAGALVLDPEIVAAVRRFLAELADREPGGELAGVATRTAEILDGLAGRAAREVLDLLAVEP